MAALFPKNKVSVVNPDGLWLSWSMLKNDEAEVSVNAGKKTMQITIDGESGIPIWLQLRNRLIYLIVSGAYQPGDKLPTVRELAVDLGVNYNTVSKVYQDIERDGYIVSKRGCGTYVAQRELSPSDSVVTAVDFLIDDFVRQCRELGVPRQDIVKLVERRLDSAK